MVASRRPRHRPFPPFEVWQSGARIVSIDNPVRLQVLAALEGGPQTLKHLASRVRKSKPTLSALHLPPLLEARLVAERQDPNDARVKWYHLTGVRLGSSSVSPPALRDAVLQYVESSGMVPLKPFLRVLDPVALARIANGSYARDVAHRLGELIGRMLTAREPAARAAELSVILEREGLGRVTYRRDEFTVRARTRGLRSFVEDLASAALRPPSPG